MGVSTSKEYKREWARKRIKDPAYRALHRKRNREYMRRKKESDPAKTAEWRHPSVSYPCAHSMFAVRGWEVVRAITTPKGQK